MNGRVLIVAGSDSGGGAGIQADIKTVTALEGYAMTAVTALTAQNTLGVDGIHEVPADFVALQMRVVLGDLGADCVKIGMLHRVDVIAAVAQVLRERASHIPVVLDPVMVAKGGAPLLMPDAVACLRETLVPLATLITPNRPEAQTLAGGDLETPAFIARLSALGARAILVKGGHDEGETVDDILLETGHEPQVFSGPRITTRHTHGTGCTLASAIATGLAQGLALRDAIRRARAYVLEAIRTAPGLGQGHGPLNHGHTVGPFAG